MHGRILTYGYPSVEKGEKKMRKILVCALALALACSMAFANGANEAAAPAQQTAGPVTVRILTTATTQNPEGPLAKEYIAAFEAANPDIKIEIEDTDNNNALKKITTLAAAGSLPDLFISTENTIGKLYDMGICDDMTPFMSQAELDNILDAVREGCTIDGQLVMYPWYSAPNALVYRTDWLEAKGLKAPKTLEEMREVAKALTGDGKYGFGLIGTADDSGETRFVMILRSFGARELYEENGVWKTEIGSPESVEAFKYFCGLKNVDNVVPPGALENSFNQNVSLFAQEQIGLLIAGSNAVGKIFAANPDLKGKVGSVQMPSAKTSYTPVSILGWSLNPESKVKDAAMKFAKFLSNKENSIKWVEVTGRMPDMKDANSESEYLNSPLMQGFVAGAASMNLAPAAPFYADVKTVLGRTYQKIMSDPSLNIEAEVQAAAKEINKIIADNT